MKKTLLAALFLAIGAGTVGLSAAGTPGTTSAMQGSDTLRNLTRDVIAACQTGGVPVAINYIGGGSGSGETQIIQNVGKADNEVTSGTPYQRVAPMSRFLQGAPGSGVCTSNSQDKAEGIEIAGDAIGVWFNKTTLAGTTNRQTACDPNAGPTDNCNGYSVGGLKHTNTIALACGASITSWKDVIRLVYFGLRPTDFPLPSTSDLNSEVNPAAIARRDCQDPCREELRATYSKLFDNNCGGVISGRLQRAFRRDEDSGTTDFFRETVNVEAGANITNKGFPFCNEFVPAVTLKTASVALAATGTGGTCTVGTTTGCPSAGNGGPYVCQANGTTCKRALNGCAVAADCASGSVCDPGQQQCVPTCTSDADCTSLGTAAANGHAPRCVANAIGTNSVCVAAVDGCKADADCNAGFVCDLNVNGGTCAPANIFNSAGASVACNATDCAAALPGGTCQTISGQSVCARTYGKVCPVPGLVFGSAVGFGGTVAGFPGVARSNVDKFGFENQQDNDLLRSAAAGAFTFAGLSATEPDTAPAEQVASTCGDLGLVLPISLPPTVSVNDPAVFPRTVCARNKFGYAPAMRIASGLNTRYLLCPNGDFPFGATGWDATLHAAIGGTGNCLYPTLSDGANKACLNAKNSTPTRVSPIIASAGLVLPPAGEGRVYNEHLWAGTATTLTTQPYTYNAGAQPVFFPAGEVEAVVNERVTGAFYRIHSTRTLQTGAGLCIAGACTADANCGTGGTCVSGVCTSGSCTANANCGTSGGVCAPPSTCTGASGTNLAGSVCCVQSADTQQIGCLVQASPNSMGFAGLAAREFNLQSNATDTTSLSPGARVDTLIYGAGLDQTSSVFTGTTGREVSPNFGNLPDAVDACIPGTTASTLQYPIARNLYLNTVEGFESLTGASKQSQLDLSQCFTGAKALTGTTIQQLIAKNGFVNLPFDPLQPAKGGYPCCRDFNEVASCNGVCSAGTCTANANCGSGGTCTGVGAACTVNADCGASGVCTSGTCTSGTCTAGGCTANSGCGTGGTCTFSGSNTPACNDNAGNLMPTNVCVF